VGGEAIAVKTPYYICTQTTTRINTGAVPRSEGGEHRAPYSRKVGP